MASSDIFAAIYSNSGASAFGIDSEEFRQIVERIADRSGENNLAKFIEGLRVEDLALAQGCARGNDAAWQRFAAQYGARLQAIALAITRDESIARDLASSLYADLFKSKKLLSYSGRGSLEGWLRAVLAQEHVNRLRLNQRLTSYEAKVDSGVQFPSLVAEERALADKRLAQSVDAALGTLKSDDRFLLASYYLDGRTLADIARTIGVHESTVSRRMEKLIVTLRKKTLRELCSRGVGGRAAEEMLASDVRDIELDIARRLMEAPPSTSGARE